jgi:hypothetical protein
MDPSHEAEAVLVLSTTATARIATNRIGGADAEILCQELLRLGRVGWIC